MIGKLGKKTGNLWRAAGGKRQSLFTAYCSLFTLFFLIITAVPLLAQDGPTVPEPHLFVTFADTNSLPAIELHVYGIDSQGSPIAITPQNLTVQHNGVPMGPLEVLGTHRAGTLTLFLIDIPTGVSDQLPAIQRIIEQYAAAPHMIEQVDAVGVYQVGETEARELLAPTIFYNSIRNLFAQPLNPATGATALIDSTMGLLDRAESLKQNPETAVSLILITDGTDAVSTAPPADLPRHAADLGIPVHTIWLNNTDLSDFSKEAGQTYLAEVATGSRALATTLDNTEQTAAIFGRTAAFREQSRVRYVVDGLTGGTFSIIVSLTDQPTITAETSITIAGNFPSVVINLPAEERAITLPSLEDPVSLRLSTSVTWLDGITRTLTAAQLKVNDTVIQDIPIEAIGEFTAEIPNLVYGNNTVQVVVLDDQGVRAASPLIALSVLEGDEQIPASLQPAGGLGTAVFTILGWLLGLSVVAGLVFMAWRGGLLNRLPALMPRGRRQAAPTVTITDTAPTEGAYAYLEVLEATTQMPEFIPLTTTVVKIGRSPTQANVAFENDVTVSRLHASLMLEGDHFRIYDEHSTSGSYVNEQQVPEYGIQLMDGDEIHLGAVHLRFRQG